MVGSRIKSGRELHCCRLCGRQLKRHGNHKYWAGNVALQEVDGCWNAAVAECQHRRPGHSSPTGTVQHRRVSLLQCRCCRQLHVVPVLQLVGCVCLYVQKKNFWTNLDISHAGSSKVKLVGQDHTSKFTITGRKCSFSATNTLRMFVMTWYIFCFFWSSSFLLRWSVQILIRPICLTAHFLQNETVALIQASSAESCN